MARKFLSLAAVLCLAVQICVGNPDVLHRRELLQGARASSRSSCVAGPNGKCEAVSSAIAKGDAKAIAQAIGEAGRNGEADAAAQAIADELKAGRPIESIAEAVAQATPLTVDEATDALTKAKEGDTSNLAQAIALSEEGRTTAVAISISQAIAKSKDATVKAITNAFSKVNAGGIADAEAKVSAAAIGQAYAKALAQVSITLEVTGTGIAIGNGKANAQALAEATATVVAEAIAKAANDFRQKEIVLKETAISTAVAEATASAFGEAELEGPGQVQVEQSTISEAVVSPFAKVVLDALVAVFEDEVDSDSYVEKIEDIKDAQATVDTQSQTEVDGEGTGVSGGEGDAVALPKCKGVAKLCCRSHTDKTECRCNFESTCHERSFAVDDKTTEWKKRKDGKVCKC